MESLLQWFSNISCLRRTYVGKLRKPWLVGTSKSYVNTNPSGSWLVFMYHQACLNVPLMKRLAFSPLFSGTLREVIQYVGISEVLFVINHLSCRFMSGFCSLVSVKAVFPIQKACRGFIVCRFYKWCVPYCSCPRAKKQPQNALPSVSMTSRCRLHCCSRSSIRLEETLSFHWRDEKFVSPYFLRRSCLPGRSQVAGLLLPFRKFLAMVSPITLLPVLFG